MAQKIELYPILVRVLKELNKQVVDHGEFVAYLFLKVAQYRGTYSDDEIEKMMLACFAHDIGAYKTEKFLSLLNFDAQHTEEHSIYGYLFMKYFSPLNEFAEVLLFHHTYFQEKETINSPYFDNGCLIHALDRIHIFTLKLEDNSEVIEQLKKGSGINFNPKDIEDFIAANEKFEILKHCRDGSYHDEIVDYFNRPDVTEHLLIPTINVLSYEVDFRSEQTVIHTITISHLAKLLGEKYKLSQEKIQNLIIAGLIHDIGKIKVPTEIVEKNGKLTFEEYAEMKKHVQYTEEIMRGIIPDEIVNLASNHHERLDGSGYPKGIKADQLSLEDRIIQVADVVSALLQKRSYKNALDKETVIRIISEDGDAGKLDKEIINIVINDYDNLINELMTESKDVIWRYEHLNSEYQEYIEKYHEFDHQIQDEFTLF